MHISRGDDNTSLTREIRDHLIAGAKGHNREDAHVDLESFDNIAPYMDWLGIIASLSSPPDVASVASI